MERDFESNTEVGSLRRDVRGGVDGGIATPFV